MARKYLVFGVEVKMFEAEVCWQSEIMFVRLRTVDFDREWYFLLADDSVQALVCTGVRCDRRFNRT